ncbi:MAG: phage baseplate assembly protein V [Methanosarcinaceae archaeon]
MYLFGIRFLLDWGVGKLALHDLGRDEDQELKGKRVEGVFLGIVTNNQDPEKGAKVKVKFPWVSEDDYWARVVTLMAGNGRGTFFIPEVGDEVLVAFDHGDINNPYVIGALWNGEDSPPEKNEDGKNNIRKIRSRLGHEVVFNDEEGKGKVEIRTKSGHKIVLDDSSGGEKIDIMDKSGNNSIRIDSAQNSIAISSQMKLNIKAQSIEIESGGMMTIKSSGTLTLQGALIKIN